MHRTNVSQTDMSRPSSCVCFAAASCVSLMPASPSSSPRSSLVRVLSYAGYTLRLSSLTPKHLAWSFVRPDFQYSTARFDAEVGSVSKCCHAQDRQQRHRCSGLGRQIQASARSRPAPDGYMSPVQVPFPGGPRRRPPPKRQVIRVARRHGSCAAMARPGKARRSARSSHADLRLVHGGLRHPGSEGSQDAARGAP